MNIKPTFCFVDERGNIAKPQEVPEFAVGAIITSYPDQLIRRLHLAHEALCSLLIPRKDQSQVEFKFSAVTLTSIECYLKALGELASDPHWRFASVIVRLDDPKFVPPSTPQQTWEYYLDMVKILLNRNLQNNEEAVLLIDYLRMPNGDVHGIETLPTVVPRLRDVLQIHSQGVILVQMADLLLGASRYIGQVEVKNKLKERAQKIRQRIGRKRFSEQIISLK